MTSHKVCLEQITDTNSPENNTRSCVLCMNLQKEAYAIVLIIGLLGHLHKFDSSCELPAINLLKNPANAMPRHRVSCFEQVASSVFTICINTPTHMTPSTNRE